MVAATMSERELLSARTTDCRMGCPGQPERAKGQMVKVVFTTRCRFALTLLPDYRLGTPNGYILAGSSTRCGVDTLAEIGLLQYSLYSRYCV